MTGKLTRAVIASVIGSALVVTLGGCSLSEGVGLAIDESAVGCFVDSGTELAVLQIPMRAEPRLHFTPDVLRVEFVDSDGVDLAGIGMVEDGLEYDASTPLPGRLVEALAVSRDDTMLLLPVAEDRTSTLVLLLRKESGRAEGFIESLRMFWSGGEPIYWQPLDVSVRLAGDCSLIVN
jgi:hypothetical protein